MPPQISDFPPESSGLDAISDCDLELAKPDGLADEVVCAASQRRDCGIEVHIAGDDNHYRLWLPFLIFDQRIEPGPVRQVDVLQYGYRLLGVKSFQCRCHRAGFERLVSPCTKRLAQRVANCRVVINDQNPLFWHAGEFYYIARARVARKGRLASRPFKSAFREG